MGSGYKNLNIEKLVHKDDQKLFKSNILKSIKNKEIFKFEVRFKNVKNKYRWILANIVPRLSEQGEFIGLLGVGLDITERKEIETKLAESEAQFTEITSVIGDGIFMIDSDLKLKFSNPEFTNLLGYTADELKDKNIHNIIHNHNEGLDSK